VTCTTRTILLLVMLLPAFACSGPAGRGAAEHAPAPLHALYGQIHSEAPLFLLPGHGWRVAQRKVRWRLITPATLICQVNRDRDAPLRLSFTADRPLDDSLQLLWNDHPDTALTLHTVGDRVEIEVPPRLLAAGVHRLTISRPVRPGAGGRELMLLEQFEYRCGEESGTLHPDRGRELKNLADFLDAGVFGGGEDLVHHGGFLFRGPLRREARLALAAPAVLQAGLGNRSGGEARFSVTAGHLSAEAVVAPREEGTIRLELPAGEHRLIFAADGPLAGRYWWDAPFPRPAAPDHTVPPIVIVTLDTTRRDAVSPYTPDGKATPELARFAAGATTFTRAHAVSPWTLPSHASIFTGRYPSDHGAGVRRGRLVPEAETLAERLRARGYHTAGFAGGKLSAARFGVAQGFDHYRDPDGYQTNARPLTRAVIDYLGSVGHAPLFLFVNYFDPHFPYSAPKGFRERMGLPDLLQALEGLPRWPELMRGDARALRDVCHTGGDVPDEALHCLRAAYHSEVAYMDQQLGRLFDELRRLGLYERAFIAVLADHGEFLGEHGFFNHSYRIDPELIEIPCLVKWPGQGEARVVDLPVSQIDLFPTILEMVGLEPGDGEGVALGPAGAEGLAHRPGVLMEEHSHPTVHKLNPGQLKLADHLYGMVGANRRHWAWEGGQRCSDLVENQWVDVECGDDWAAGLAGLRLRFGTAEPADLPPAETLDPAEREQLRLLGYME